MQIVSRLIVPKMKPESNDGNIRCLEPFANQHDYHDIRYEESQDEEEPEEPLGIVTLIACYFIWSISQTSIGGWGIRLPTN